MPRYRETVLVASAGAAVGVGGVDLVAAVAGDVDHVSRGIDRRADFPPPTRMSMIVSERLGWPISLAPGSLEFLVRASEPSTRIVFGEVSVKPESLERAAGRVGDALALDLGGDQEQQQREQQPADDRTRAT